MAESEKATLLVGGHRFEDWESVWVQHTWGEAFSQFKFTAAERDPTPEVMALLQFKPGDDCTIEMAGELAITGVILTRQAAFDENNHGVMLQGVSNTWAAARSSIIHKTNNFRGKSFMQIAEEVLEPTKVKGKPLGTISDKIFERMRPNTGESIFQFLERIGRERDIIVTCDKHGNFLFVGKNPPASNLGQLTEGVNIRKCQCVVSDSLQRSMFSAVGNSSADDKDNMRKQAEQAARADGKLKQYSAIQVPNEQPVWTNKEIEERANNEAKWTEAQQIQATIVVQGWTASSGGLWEAGKNVTVKSKMAMLDMELAIQQVTYTQDNNTGSLTTLLCVAPWGLNGKRNPFAPSAAKPDTGPPKTGG